MDRNTEGVRIELPYPPSVNHYWKHERWSGRVYVSACGKDYRREVYFRVKGARPGAGAIEGPLYLHAAIFPPDARRRDLDNTLKAMLDALQHAGAYHDDNQISQLVVTRQEIVTGGRVVVFIRPSVSVVPVAAVQSALAAL